MSGGHLLPGAHMRLIAIRWPLFHSSSRQVSEGLRRTGRAIPYRSASSINVAGFPGNSRSARSLGSRSHKGFDRCCGERLHVFS